MNAIRATAAVALDWGVAVGRLVAAVLVSAGLGPVAGVGPLEQAAVERASDTASRAGIVAGFDALAATAPLACAE